MTLFAVIRSIHVRQLYSGMTWTVPTLQYMYTVARAILSYTDHLHVYRAGDPRHLNELTWRLEDVHTVSRAVYCTVRTCIAVNARSIGQAASSSGRL
jgi:hypothetical protein